MPLIGLRFRTIRDDDGSRPKILQNILSLLLNHQGTVNTGSHRNTSQAAITAYFSSKQLLLFVLFAYSRQNSGEPQRSSESRGLGTAQSGSTRDPADCVLASPDHHTPLLWEIRKHRHCVINHHSHHTPFNPKVLYLKKFTHLKLCLARPTTSNE